MSSRRSAKVGLIPADNGDIIERLNDHETRLGRIETPGGEARGAGYAKTEAVLFDLGGRLSYFRREVDLFQSWSLDDGTGTITLFNQPFGAPVDFVLNEPRLVRIATTASLTVSFTAHDVNRSGSAGIGIATVIDGVFGTYSDEVDQIFADVSLGSPVTRVSSDFERGRVELYLELDAGPHTVSAGLNTVQVTANGSGPWAAYLTAAAPAIAVDVLQPLPPPAEA